MIKVLGGGVHDVKFGNLFRPLNIIENVKYKTLIHAEYFISTGAKDNASENINDVTLIVFFKDRI